MGKPLRIRALQIKDHRGWQAPYDLDGRLVAITGPIDRGKTSMVDCIDFVLGRNVQFRGAVHDDLREVSARISVDGRTYRLRRSRKSDGTIGVATDRGKKIDWFPVQPRGGKQGFSDWLLDQLGLADDFAAVRRSGQRSLGFAHDLLPHLHIRQEDIDRFIIRPASDSESAARKAVTELLLNLSSQELEEARAQMQDLSNRIERHSEKLRDIRAFLGSTGDPTALDAERERLLAREQQAREHLRALRNRAREAVDRTDRRELVEAQSQWHAAESALHRARQQHDALTTEVESLDASLAALADAKANAMLATDWEHCHACGNSLADRVVPAEHCSVCTLPLPESARAAEKARLLQARTNASERRDAAAEQLRDAERAAQRAEEEFNRVSEIVDDRTAEAVAPFADALTRAASDLGAVRAQLEALARLHEPHERLAERDEEIQRLKAEREEAEHRRDLAARRLVDRDEILDHLDGLFRKIVAGFELPWATGRARIDRDTLLPMVDEQDFAQRGGGSRTAVSVAYSLALLLHAMEDTRSKLPTLLILDSPQKNLGNNSHDQQLAERIYGWIASYISDQRDTYGDRYNEYQLIVVDNDIPADVLDRFDVIQRFDEDRGFIRDLRDPHGAPEEPVQLALGDGATS